MAEIETWPIEQLAPMDIAGLVPDYMTQPGFEATNGMVRQRGRAGAKMRLQLIDIPVYDEATWRVMTAMLAILEGGSTLCRIRVPSRYGLDGPFTPAWRERRAAFAGGLPFASQVLFSSGVGWSPSWSTGTLAEDAGLNARQVLVSETAALPGGVLISIEDFVYVMRRAWQEHSTVNRVELSPPLRKATAAGTAVDYAPVFVGHLVTDSPGMAALRAGKYGRFTLEFVEDLTRLVESVA